MRIAMKHEPIDAGAESPIALILERRGKELPRFRSVSRERLGRDDRPAIGVGNRSRFDATEQGLHDKPLRPELAHRHVRHRPQRHVASGVHVIRFNRQPKTVASAQFPQVRRVLADDQFLSRPAQVPQKPLRQLPGSRRPDPSSRAGIWRGIVSAAPLELRGKLRAPVLRTHLPTVDVQHRPTGGPVQRAWPDRPQQLANELTRSAHRVRR